MFSVSKTISAAAIYLFFSPFLKDVIFYSKFSTARSGLFDTFLKRFIKNFLSSF